MTLLACLPRALAGAAMALWWLLPVLGVFLGALWLLRALMPHAVPDIEVDASDIVARRRLRGDKSNIILMRQGATVRCFDPATLEFLGHVPALTTEEVKSRVLEARKAQKVWAGSSFEQRRDFLRILLKYILGHQELICQVSARDSGKTMVDAALGEIIITCEKIGWLLKEGERWLKPEYRSSGKMMLHKSARVEYHPLGVIGAIVPWNYPFHNIFNPMLAAVFAGNGIVIKVSEHASWSGVFYMRIIEAALSAAGAPVDLVHVISGFGETGEALVSSVDKVIFVGSTAIGKKVMATAAKSLTPVVLELGGKDAFIVCEDADLSQVVPIAVRGALQSSGQNCANAERFYVHCDIYKSFVHEICQIVESVRVGPPIGEQVDMGAICMPGHAEKLESLVQDAVSKGAKIAARGKFVKGLVGSGHVGQFYLPTVLVDVNHSMQIMQDEVFGPIISIMPFSSDEEAIELENDCKFGLGGSVFSADRERARRIASQMSCGMVAINDFMASYMCQALPFGGFKESGIDRVAGVEGLRGCCNVRSFAEDRIPFVKTVIPKLIQYPVAENAFEFQQALVKFFYGLTFLAKLQGLFELVTIFFSRGPGAPGAKKKA